ARDEAQNVQSEPASLRFDFNTPPNTRVLADDSGQVLIYRFAGKDSNSRTLDIMFRWRIDQGDWSDWTSEASLQATDLLAKADHGEHVLYVQSRDAAGNVDPTPAELVVDIDKRPPPPPASVSIVSQDDGGEITLSWDPSPEANVSYRVYRSTTEKLNKAEAFTVEMDTTRPRSSDRPRRGETSMTLYYFVTSVDRSGNESEETPAKPEIVLGMKEINEKKFELYRTDVDKQIRSSQWDQVLQMADNVPMELITPPERAPYQTFWRNLASAKKALAESPTRPEALAASRNDLDAFIQVNPAFPQVKEAQDAFEEVKSALLWHRLKFFGMIGAALIVALFVLSMIYRWVQNRRIPEMPMIHAGTGTEGVTPTKEALKDPTVLRRWTEVQAEPTSAENWSRLAFAFHNIGEVENAIQSLYKAMEIEPNNTRFHFQMGHFQKEAGRTKDAIRHFERYLQLNPESKKSAEEVRELLGKLKAEEEKRG
ncbi:MAG: hypothetical protein HUU16_20600, partial [Candidatus Omnitrophica bacterium]|nr:hypothetical protein [Candidatus Omnitrophota bacterium]